ncbi:ABC transporter substrate-binding protein [Aureimonas frigidaquae]|uniref:ABC transporter substrate-binding protein n=1 Tax=Aureimonas frigidaquae TaxID=424757 RepID=UPI000780B8B7|nr:ABC transporter substrate-binding protein [Aureimonas frigidaquae]
MRRLTAILAFALAAFLGNAHAAPRSDVVIGMSIEPAGLDPTVAAPVSIGQVVWQNLFQGLVRIAEDGSVRPQLASDWTISPDGLTYRFTLRQGVTFHNGAAFSSATARFALERARGADSANPQKRFFETIERIETPDAATLVLHLTRPTGNLLYWLGWPAAVMVEEGSAATNRTQPVGTGPFRFGGWTAGDSVRLVRFDGYWDAASRPALDSATFRFINDAQAQMAALQSGQVDAFPEFAAPELFGRLEGDAGFTTVVGNTELKVVAGINARRAPFNDPRVRRALMMAVDRHALVAGAWSGYGTPIGSHYTPNDPGFVDLTGTIPYDPAGARALLAQAGLADGFEATIKTPQMPYATRSAEILQAFLAEIGVRLTIEPTEFPAAWVDQVFTRHDFDLTIVAHAEPMDIDIYARPNYYFGYADANFDSLIEQAETATDPQARAAFYAEAQRKLAGDVPALFLFVMPKLGVWRAGLDGFWHDEPIPSNDLTNVRWVE